MKTCKYGKLKHKVGGRRCKKAPSRRRSTGWAKIAKHAAAKQKREERAWRSRSLPGDFGRYKSRRRRSRR